MRVALFSAKAYDRQFFDAANRAYVHDIQYFDVRLDPATALLAHGFTAVCVFVNDRVDTDVLAALAHAGVRLVALRCAGFNNVDLAAAQALNIEVVRVPAYSPQSVAEFTLAMILALDRNIPRAWNRVRDNNFTLDGLVGRDLAGRTAAVIGTGRIGRLVARMLRLGFGCEVIASDAYQDADLVAAGVRYEDADTAMREADLITLHCPLTPATRHLINAAVIDAARPSVMIVNTSRGALIDTTALIAGLKSGKVGSVALDVYEQEGDLFFQDLSSEVVQDDVFQRLLTFPNVLVTGHQAFLTEEALHAIAATTLANIAEFGTGVPLANRVSLANVTA